MKNTEIERKFLVVNDSFKALATKAYHIAQGYLSKDPHRVVRIRVRDEEAFLTIKAVSESAATHFEYETAVDIDSARQLLGLCLDGKIEKTRYIVPEFKSSKVTKSATSDSKVMDFGTLEHETLQPVSLFWEVDVFHADNEGLIVAEIELPYEDYPFEKPDFVGEEVTEDTRYYNAALSEHPYKTW